MATRIPLEVDGKIAQVYQHPRSSSWWIDYFRDGQRVRHSLAAPDAATALEKARQELARKGEVSPQVLRRLSVQEAVDRYLTVWSPEVHRPVTQRRYKAVLNELIGRVGADRKLREVGRQHIFDWRNDKKEAWVLDPQGKPKRRISPHTVNNVLLHARAFFKWAMAEGMIDHDPCYKIPRVKTSRVAKPAPTRVEVRALVARAEAMSKKAPEYAYIRDWIIVANATGLRPGEQVHLRKKDLHLFQRYVQITPYDGWTPKDYEERKVVIDPEALPVLAKLSKATSSPDLPLFDGRGGTIRDPHYVGKLFRDVAVAEALDYSPYDLRHAYASRKVAQGVDIQWLMVQLGHSSVETLLRWYADRRHLQGAPRMRERAKPS
jgi:integrase